MKTLSRKILSHSNRCAPSVHNQHLQKNYQNTYHTWRKEKCGASWANQLRIKRKEQLYLMQKCLSTGNFKTENASLQIHSSISSVSVLWLWIQDRIKVHKSKTHHLGPTPTGKIASCRHKWHCEQQKTTERNRIIDLTQRTTLGPGYNSPRVYQFSLCPYKGEEKTMEGWTTKEMTNLQQNTQSFMLWKIHKLGKLLGLRTWPWLAIIR